MIRAIVLRFMEFGRRSWVKIMCHLYRHDLDVLQSLDHERWLKGPELRSLFKEPGDWLTQSIGRLTREGLVESSASGFAEAAGNVYHGVQFRLTRYGVIVFNQLADAVMTGDARVQDVPSGSTQPAE